MVLIITITRRVPYVEQELHTLSEHLSSPPPFSWVRVVRTLVFCVMFLLHCLFFFRLSFVHFVVYPFTIYIF